MRVKTFRWFAPNLRYCQFGILVLLSLFVLSPVQAGPLNEAAYAGDLAQVKRLIFKGVNVNTKLYNGQTALMAASFHGYGDIVKVLLARGAKVNAKNNEGGAALIIATQAALRVTDSTDEDWTVSGFSSGTDHIYITVP